MSEKNPNWWMYVLECADGTLYTGVAIDPDKRLAAHNAGKGAKYVRSRLPARMLVQWKYFSQGEALRAENAFKNMRRPAKLKAINGDLLP